MYPCTHLYTTEIVVNIRFDFGFYWLIGTLRDISEVSERIQGGPEPMQGAML